MNCDSLMPFNRCEFTVAYLRWLSFRTASTALTPLGDVPVPLNRRIGGESFNVGGAQAVRASAAMHEKSWMLRSGFDPYMMFLRAPSDKVQNRNTPSNTRAPNPAKKAR